jgi:hypothetical protein
MDCELCNELIEEASICYLPCGNHLCHYCVIECLAKHGAADAFCCPCGQPCNYISLIRAREVVTETESGRHAHQVLAPMIIEISKSNPPQHHIIDSFRTFSMDKLHSLEKEDQDSIIGHQGLLRNLMYWIRPSKQEKTGEYEIALAKWSLSAEGEYLMGPEDEKSFMESIVLLHKPIMRLLAIDEDKEYFEDDCNGDDDDSFYSCLEESGKGRYSQGSHSTSTLCTTAQIALCSVCDINPPNRIEVVDRFQVIKRRFYFLFLICFLLVSSISSEIRTYGS